MVGNGIKEGQLQPYPQHPPETIERLALRLIQNGLRDVDQATLELRLEQVGYFRLKGYWYPFLTPIHPQSEKRALPFREGTSFNDIWCRYEFDQELRTLVFDGIVTIEIYLKNFLASELSSFGGEFGYLNRSGLPNLGFDEYLECLRALRESYKKSRLPYLMHFKHTYNNPLPPYWMIVGCLSYGTLKQYLYEGSTEEIKRKLAIKFHIFNTNSRPEIQGDIKILSQWLEVIRQARNMVAHHDRFWNESSNRIAPKLPHHRSGAHAQQWWGNDWNTLRTSKGPAAFLTMEQYILKQIIGASWSKRFIALMDRYPQIPISDMGFPKDWQTMSLWSE